MNSLFSGEVDFGEAVALTISILVVDGHVLFTTCAAIAVFFVNSNLFLLMMRAIGFVDVGGEGRVFGFLVFPSARKIGLSFYSDASRFLGGGVGVVGVRRRED